MRLSRLFPDLERLDSPAEREAVYNEAFRRLYRRPRFWAFMVLVPGAAAATTPVVIKWLSGMLPVTGPVVGGLIGGVFGFTFAWLMQVAFRRPLQRLIRLELVERGVSVCVECGYDLRGQTTPRCPECGTGFVVRKEAAPASHVAGPNEA